MPKIWSGTIEAHRRAVQEATLDTTAALVAEHGLRAVTMSRIAEAAGIGRATLYKYFRDVESILVAWHERQVHSHLRELAKIRDRDASAASRLESVLETFALMLYEHHGSELATLLHAGPHVAGAQRELMGFVRELVAEGAENGELRDDVSADELATYCLHALTAASTLPGKAAVRRLVGVTLAGLGPRAKNADA